MNENQPTFPLTFCRELTAIEHAAIHTGQPVSGTPWLDNMLAQARRERLAGQALAGFISSPNYSPTYEGEQEASAALDIADALISALEGGGK